MAIRGGPGGLACWPAEKNAGRARMLNSLAHKGPPHIGLQPTRAKGEAERADPMARLQNYMFSFF